VAGMCAAHIFLTLVQTVAVSATLPASAPSGTEFREVLSLYLQLVGIAGAMVYGWCKPTERFVVLAAGYGILLDIVAQILVAGGGPGACVGFVILPVYVWVAAHLGRGIRMLFGPRVPPAPPERHIREFSQSEP
jgi:hypothetical protein